MLKELQRHREMVRERIQKSFESDLNIIKAEEDLFEKAKWNVGDEKVYQGVTYVVGGFNAKGTPLWRKKKDGDSGDSGKTVKTDKPTSSVTSSQDDNAGKGSTTATQQKPKQGELKERDSVIKFAKNNNTFKNVKSNWNGEDDAKAFELKLGKITFTADFLNSTEFLGIFENEDGDVLYDMNVNQVEDIDWDSLFNNTLDWIVDRKSKLKNNLNNINKKIAAAEKKYNRTRKSDDFNRFNYLEKHYNAVKRTIKKLDELISNFK